MKKRYIIIITLLLLGAGAFIFVSLSSSSNLHPNIGDLLQGLGIFVALLASVIALSASDPKLKRVNVAITSRIDEESIGNYHKTDFSPDLQKIYGDYPDTVLSYKVYFDMLNTSGFTLKKPTVTFRLPMDRQHPKKDRDSINYNRRSFHSNLFNYQRDLVSLETADTLILSNSNLPYWNDKEGLYIWIRMVFPIMEPFIFSVEVSVNCDNAEGITRTIHINPSPVVSDIAKHLGNPINR